VPTLFNAVRAAGRRTALFAGKEKFTHFRDSDCCDVWRYSTGGDQDLAGQAAVEASAGIDLLVVHLPDVDLAGHANRWMSESYLAAVGRADDAVGRIVGSLPPYATLIVTADHGGRPTGHGSADPVDTTIPWIIVGPTIVQGRELSSLIRTVDTAATAAYVLGISLPGGVSGRPVLEAFSR
jgi:phosphopentomutase